MGRSWFSIVNKVIKYEAKEKKEQKTEKPKRRWFGIRKSKDSVKSPSLTDPSIVEGKPYESNKQNRQALVMATSAAAKAALSAAQAAAEVVRLAIAIRTAGISSEESAAIKIQTAFRAYMARRALRALRGLARLKSLVEGQYVKGQATVMLRSMQTLTRIQSQVRETRSRTLGRNTAPLMQQKEEKETQEIGEGWDDSTKSKEDVEAELLGRKEAAVRREKALAYAYSHQTWRNSSKVSQQEPEDSSKLYKGWSWLERWMASHPWEAKSILDNNINSQENKSVKGLSSSHAELTIPKPTMGTRKQSSKTTQIAAKGNNETLGKLSGEYNRHSLPVGMFSSRKDRESQGSSSRSSPLRSYTTGKQQVKLRPSLSNPSRLGPREQVMAGPTKKRLLASKSVPGIKRRLSDPSKGTASGQIRKGGKTVKADKLEGQDNP